MDSFDTCDFIIQILWLFGINRSKFVSQLLMLSITTRDIQFTVIRTRDIFPYNYIIEHLVLHCSGSAYLRYTSMNIVRQGSQLPSVGNRNLGTVIMSHSNTTYSLGTSGYHISSTLYRISRFLCFFSYFQNIVRNNSKKYTNTFVDSSLWISS